MKTARTAILLLATVANMLAQGGANYTAFGLGQQRTTFGAAYEGLGGAAYAVPSDYLFGIANPALWPLVKTTRIQGGYRFNQQRVEQEGVFRAQNNGKLDGAGLLFALDTSAELAASIGVFPATSVNYVSLRRFQISLPDVGILDGTTTYRGGGGLTMAYAGFALRVVPGLYAGGALLYGFGLISDQTETTVAADITQRALSTQNDRLSTVGSRIGLYAELGDHVRVGMAGTFFRSLQVERLFVYQSFLPNTIQPTFDTSLTTSFATPMATTLGGGLTYTHRRLLLTLDGEWSSTEVLTYRYSRLARAESSFRFSLAASYRGNPAAGQTFGERVTLNGGVSMQRMPVVMGSAPLNEYAASIGLQIPFGGAAMIDAALIAGVRGNGLPVREEFLRLSLTLSVGEVWFIPFRR